MESVIGLFETEAIRTDIFHEGPFRKVSDVEFAAAGWVDWWKHQRLHSSIENLTPYRVRTAPLRRFGSGAPSHMKAAENLGCFSHPAGVLQTEDSDPCAPICDEPVWKRGCCGHIEGLDRSLSTLVKQLM